MQRYHQVEQIGAGSYGNIFKAIDDSSGTVIAYKKSRTSLHVKRPCFRHEARILQLLQGHPAISTFIGYRRSPHFEYIAMELLGKDLREMVLPEHALKLGTVVRIAEQMLSALNHLNSHNIVHRDIKPSNILLCTADPSLIRLLDFGISRYLPGEMKTRRVKRYDPIKDKMFVVGTMDWSSLDAHDGFDLRLHDDLESLVYTLFFLLHGYLPWKLERKREPYQRRAVRVQVAKVAFSDAMPIPDTPIEFSDLFRLARSGEDNIQTSLPVMQERMHCLSDRLGEQEGSPLDWTPVPMSRHPDPPDSLSKFTGAEWKEDEEFGRCQVVEYYDDSYDAWDNSAYIPLYDREESLTFPIDEADSVDDNIPEIATIQEPNCFWVIRAHAKCVGDRQP